LGEGVPLEQERQRGAHLTKRHYFAAIGCYSVKTVADRYRLAAYHNKHCWRLFRFVNVDDLERAHISTVNCDEMAGDRPRQPAYEILSIKRRF